MRAGGVKPADEATLKLLVDAYNAKDVDRFLGCYWERAAIYRQGESDPLYQGVEEIREVYAKAFREHPGLKVEILGRMAVGAFVIDKERVSGKADGSSYDAVVIYQMEDARVRNAWVVT